MNLFPGFEGKTIDSHFSHYANCGFHLYFITLLSPGYDPFSSNNETS